MTQVERLLTQGIRREGSPRAGFRYRRPDGSLLPRSERERLDALRLPPAWTDVAINPSPMARLQAIGKDKAGRWQYRYHPAFVQRREQRKFQRLVDFAGALPRMRAAIQRDLRRPGLGRERVLGCMLRILSTCFIRPGSQEYANEHGHYGLATLQPRHVRVHGHTVTFHFTGKSGKERHRELRDPRVARVIRQLLAVPSKQVFKYIDEEGTVHEVRRQHLNDYIKEVMGSDFTAKDFRTWAGTLMCACALARVGADGDDSRTARQKKIVAAIKETAAVLGNTPAICRASYVYPSILNGFEQGRIIESHFETVEELAAHKGIRLHHAEAALLKMLRAEAVHEVRKASAKVIPLHQKTHQRRAPTETRVAAMRR